jgi:ketopantoate reductase PanE/ApbA-like protein
MIRRILILGASYGSLFGTKLLMASHDVTLVCRRGRADLINARGTEVCFPSKGDTAPHRIRSTELSGRLEAKTPEMVDPSDFDLVVLAMQEPHYLHHAMRALLNRIANARVPCLSIMNMPPLPYLKRIDGIDPVTVEAAYSDPRVWDRLDSSVMTSCSPDPQAGRPANEPANVLSVNLPTNFKAATFASAVHNEILRQLADDIDAIRLNGHEVPVKLRLHDSLFVPFAKWPMLLTGNYRCVTAGGPISIREAVGADLSLSSEVYSTVESIVLRLGGSAENLVAFDKYVAATEKLVAPSSVARAIAGGAPAVERVDKLVQIIGHHYGIAHPVIDRTVASIDAAIARTTVSAA